MVGSVVSASLAGGSSFGDKRRKEAFLSVVVEVATSLTTPDWYSLQTLPLTGDTFQAVRIYRLRIP